MAIGEETEVRSSLFPMLIKSNFALSFFALATITLRAGDWPQWRGPDRDGHSAGPLTISSLPKELKPVWKNAIGPGFSAPIVSGGKLIYLDEQEGREVAHCLLAATGQEIWKTPYANTEGDEWGSGPRTTPFVVMFWYAGRSRLPRSIVSRSLVARRSPH